MPRAEVVWAEAASDDLFTLLDPLRSTAPKRALRLMNKLVSAVSRLADFPESGRKPFEITEDERVREIVVEQLRLFYNYDHSRRMVQVMAIFNARQNVETLYRQRFDAETN